LFWLDAVLTFCSLLSHRRHHQSYDVAADKFTTASSDSLGTTVYFHRIVIASCGCIGVVLLFHTLPLPAFGARSCFHRAQRGRREEGDFLTAWILLLSMSQIQPKSFLLSFLSLAWIHIMMLAFFEGTQASNQ